MRWEDPPVTTSSGECGEEGMCEEEILIPVAKGWTNHEIADDMNISISTVKTHLASLMRKLSARNRVELAMWAHETRRI